MTNEQCLSLLTTQFTQDSSQRENLSKLTTDARGNEKYSCLNQVANGSLVQLSSLLDTIEQGGQS
ncbi:hypothetical protein J5893_00740 [bacterium]|nr:hypothetical protein [bacterium]